jgi:mannose-6-phosphate isomerase class I
VNSYDLKPFVAVPGGETEAAEGWESTAARLRLALGKTAAERTLLIVECYPGVDEASVLQELRARLNPGWAIGAADALRPPAEIEALVGPDLGSDPVFGRLSALQLPQFFDAARLAQVRASTARWESGLGLIVGCGATHLASEGLPAAERLLVYADLPRWEAQLRFRRGGENLGARNGGVATAIKYKRAFFVDWRVADRWKVPVLAQCDFCLDTTVPALPKLATGSGIRAGLSHAVTRPFRVVPFFDPAPWGGQWMRQVFGLEGSAPNYGWCFDCVPEENSLVLGFGAIRFELPALDLVLSHPAELLGRDIHARFGAEFPIRFDLLDTMGGGDLSFQVHPLVEFARRAYGLTYTQDESYYLLDAGPDASVMLGLRDDVQPADLIEALRLAKGGGAPFLAERFANRWPARKHDHSLSPAGTVHCSGANAMVLEISATPYIFTFKLWDWGRVGLDGKPRPIHLTEGVANIRWDRRTAMTRGELVNAVSQIGEGPGWREERTGLHETEFIESRRHWFTGPVPHDTAGTVNVLNLVEGDAAVVESPTGAFAPMEIHYAETFIVPAAVGPYTIRPSGAPGERGWATVKAFVRPG